MIELEVSDWFVVVLIEMSLVCTAQLINNCILINHVIELSQYRPFSVQNFNTFYLNDKL